jgi:NAD(P)-dependent dehydrogenase (short-subunit alcohol dehydrogenase family)
MAHDFTGKVVLITGAAQGIGRCLAVAFGMAGARVVLVDVDEPMAREAAGEVASLAAASRALALGADVADESAVRRVVDAAVAEYGRLDVVVNNAATSCGSPPELLDLADWQRVLAVNLTGPFLLSRHAAPHLRQQQGAIVNIASTRAYMSEPNSEAYAASKGGLVALTHALAASLAPAVRVNAIAPGWIDTAAWRRFADRREPTHSDADREQHWSGRVGRPEDIAALALLLADGAHAGFINGQCLTCDGGMTRKMIYT